MRTRLTAALYALTIFLSAFLLFQIQPLISKCLLPWFGGTPNVWTTCLLFFQAVLFGGYVYAHLLTRKLAPPGQALVHLIVLCSVAAAVQILPAADQQPDPTASPVQQILLVLGLTVGLPYFVLSTTGPLLQSWFGRALPGVSPYRLYALSNTGSLLALISYPFVFEPLTGMATQAAWWTQGFMVFAVLCGLCASIVARTRHTASCDAATLTTRPAAIDSRVTWRVRATWFGLALTASTLLLATTNQVCLDVAVVPFLWVVPLGLYLLTFILCFEAERWYSRRVCGPAGVLAMVLTTFLMLQNAGTSLVLQVTVAFGAMFLGCMICHGELVRRKPHPEELTSYYLIISAGGAAGGLFVGLLAPLVFPLYLEMHVAIAVCCALGLAVTLRDQRERDGRPEWVFRLGAVVVIVGVAAALQQQAFAILEQSAAVRRNFYGVLRVEHRDVINAEEHALHLRYGRILHGMQFAAPHKRRLATTYYGPESGIGRLVTELQRRRQSLRVGVVGLGVGTLATYGRPSDVLRFYEINPDVTSLASDQFTYLSDSPAVVEIVAGDARLMLEREPEQRYDLLVLDAFSGDAVPAHLLTREALAVYQRQLAPGGVLACHISNLHFDLQPVVAALADAADWPSLVLTSRGDNATGQTPSTWFAATADRGLLKSPALRAIGAAPRERRSLWTDDFSDLFSLLK